MKEKLLISEEEFTLSISIDSGSMLKPKPFKPYRRKWSV